MPQPLLKHRREARRPHRATLEPERKNLRTGAPRMQLFGKGQQSSAVESFQARCEDGQAGDEESRTCGSPCIQIVVAGGDEVGETLFVLAANRSREMPVLRSLDGCGREHLESRADCARQGRESREVAVTVDTLRRSV